MNRSFYQENHEQKFPYILPVLRSYKQSTMFNQRVNEIDVELPSIFSRSIEKCTINEVPRKKKAKRKKFNNSSFKAKIAQKFSPGIKTPTNKKLDFW